MPIVNPLTAYAGSTAAAILLSDGSTRIYYQGADGAIHEASGNGPAVNNSHYNDRVVAPAELVRINSPIAADHWSDGSLRVYFIDKDNFLREFNGTTNTSQGFSEGLLSSFKYKAAVNSGLLYAVASEISNNRVGYQAAEAPDRITETIWGASDPHWTKASFN